MSSNCLESHNLLSEYHTVFTECECTITALCASLCLHAGGKRLIRSSSNCQCGGSYSPSESTGYDALFNFKVFESEDNHQSV